jgi:hypothetical protein
VSSSGEPDTVDLVARYWPRTQSQPTTQPTILPQELPQDSSVKLPHELVAGNLCGLSIYNGRRGIRTCDFHRVRLTFLHICFDSTTIRGTTLRHDLGGLQHETISNTQAQAKTVVT